MSSVWSFITNFFTILRYLRFQCPFTAYTSTNRLLKTVSSTDTILQRVKMSPFVEIIDSTDIAPYRDDNSSMFRCFCTIENTFFNFIWLSRTLWL